MPPTAPDAEQPSGDAGPALLTASDVRTRAHQLQIRPTKVWGQNFVVDPNTIRRIVRLSGVDQDDVVLEVGPGLGSLTLGLLGAAAAVIAVEIDPELASALPLLVAERDSDAAARLEVETSDALQLTQLTQPPDALVANLPYNVAVPVVLTLLERFPSIARVLVMVQLEVAERLAAAPGSRIYGAPSVKAAWYADVTMAGTVPRRVFWPVPNVDSGLVSMTRRPPPRTDVPRAAVFACIDAAFSQRRKTLRAALAQWAGSPSDAETILRRAGIDPRSRGEQLGVAQFADIVAARDELGLVEQQPTVRKRQAAPANPPRVDL